MERCLGPSPLGRPTPNTHMQGWGQGRLGQGTWGRRGICVGWRQPAGLPGEVRQGQRDLVWQQSREGSPGGRANLGPKPGGGKEP